MLSPFDITDPNLGSPELLRAVTKALKNEGVAELAAVDPESVKLSNLFSPSGRLAKYNFVAICEENRAISLPEDVEPLRFLLQSAMLDPVPEGKVVAVTYSMAGRSGQMNAIVFSRRGDELAFEENRFLGGA